MTPIGWAVRLGASAHGAYQHYWRVDLDDEDTAIASCKPSLKAATYLLEKRPNASKCLHCARRHS